MSPILNSPMAKRLLRPATTLVDQRVQRPVSRLRKELDALRREVKELEQLRRQVGELRGQEYAVGLLFDRTGRSGPGCPPRRRSTRWWPRWRRSAGPTRRRPGAT